MNFLLQSLEGRTTKANVFTICGLNLSALSAGWTSEEERWWPASILMFNPISVSTPDKPLLPVIHHLHNNGTPRTLINNINLPCPLSRTVHCALCTQRWCNPNLYKRLPFIQAITALNKYQYTSQMAIQTSIFMEKEELKEGLIESQIQINFPSPNCLNH